MPAFSTLYLQASDLPDDEDIILTIRSFERKELRQDDRTVMKWVLYFEEIEEGLALNDTNGRAIRRLLGKEMEGWRGKRIILYVHPSVEYNGVHLRGIRVRSTSVSAQPDRSDGSRSFSDQEGVTPINEGETKDLTN